MGFDWTKGFTIGFDLNTGLSEDMLSSKRRASNMKGMYLDSEAERKVIEDGDPLLYEFYEMGAPSESGDIASGTSILYPGKIGNEYYMTAGHFHTILETAEVYYCLSGNGYMLVENKSGDTHAYPLSPGRMVYVPKGYAHRSINTGSVPMVTFFAFRGDAGHDYGSIKEKGFRKLIIEKDGKPEIIDNPRWKE
jgi:glucose-6-phosphate isomerase